MSTLRVDTLRGQTTGTNRYVVQVQSTMITGTVTHDQTTVKDITGLNVDITPQSTSNKILVTACIGSCVIITSGSGPIQFSLTT